MTQEPPSPPAPPHSVLPLDAQLMLQKAASVKATKQDPMARAKAIETATKRVRYMYPQYFK